MTILSRREPILVERDEEQIEGLSFLVYCRTGNSLHLPATGSSIGLEQVIPTDLQELTMALEQDAWAGEQKPQR